MSAPVKKAEPVVLWCPVCERDYTPKNPRRKHVQKYCSQRCSFRALREDWPGLHREISEDRDYPGYEEGVYQHDDDGEGGRRRIQ